MPDVVIVSPVDELRELGATTSADLSLKSQIGFVVSTGRSSAAWMLSGFRSRYIEVNSIIQGIQRAFTSKISGLSHELVGETRSPRSYVAAASV